MYLFINHYPVIIERFGCSMYSKLRFVVGVDQRLWVIWNLLWLAEGVRDNFRRSFVHDLNLRTLGSVCYFGPFNA